MTNRIEEMETFVLVVDSGGYTAAARLLGKSPSTISKLITRLENRLGVQMFYRNSRHLKLTEDGSLFYELSQAAIEATHFAEAMVSQQASEPVGVIRVRTLLSFAKYQVAPLMGEFVSRYPKLRVEFRLGPLPSDLFEERTDLAVWSGTLEDSSLIAKPLTTSKWTLCASQSYLDQAGIPRHPADLQHHNCLGFTFQTNWNFWRFSTDEVPFDGARSGNIASDQGELLLSLALQGVGIVRLADFHIHEYVLKGDLIPILTEFQLDEPEPIYMVYPAKRNLSARVKLFMDFLNEKLGNSPPWTML